MIVTARLTIALGILTSIASGQATKPVKAWTGWVSDTKCGKTINKECSAKCLAEGAHVIIVSDADQQLIKIANEDKLKQYEGEHVSVTGTLVAGALQVQSVKQLGKAVSQ